VRIIGGSPRKGAKLCCKTQTSGAEILSATSYDDAKRPGHKQASAAVEPLKFWHQVNFFATPRRSLATFATAAPARRRKRAPVTHL
jgi:hypothetical protein